MLHKDVDDNPIYLKTFTLRDVKDIPEIKSDIENHMILIIRITPIAQKDVNELRIAVEQLYKSAILVGGDISRLGEERIIITPHKVKIWHKDSETQLTGK